MKLLSENGRKLMIVINIVGKNAKTHLCGAFA